MGIEVRWVMSCSEKGCSHMLPYLPLADKQVLISTAALHSWHNVKGNYWICPKCKDRIRAQEEPLIKENPRCPKCTCPTHSHSISGMFNILNCGECSTVYKVRDGKLVRVQ